HP
ncbi:hypothetical protein D043_2605B, partial [Vibrio parahaemolyticus EKP-021]